MKTDRRMREIRRGGLFLCTDDFLLSEQLFCCRFFDKIGEKRRQKERTRPKQHRVLHLPSKVPRLAEEAALSEDVLNELKELISIKNHFGAEELLAKQNLRSEIGRASCRERV